MDGQRAAALIFGVRFNKIKKPFLALLFLIPLSDCAILSPSPDTTSALDVPAAPSNLRLVQGHKQSVTNPKEAVEAREAVKIREVVEVQPAPLPTNSRVPRAEVETLPSQDDTWQVKASKGYQPEFGEKTSPSQTKANPPKTAGTVGQRASVVNKENFSLLIGQRTWLSNGISDTSNAGLGGVPNVLSFLKWDNVDSTVFQFTSDALIFKRYILSADVGFGAISGGSLRDQDFLGNNRTLLFSESKSVADDDDLFYVNLDVGYRLMYCCPHRFSWDAQNKKPRGTLDLLIGYQHWREKYVATEGVQTQNLFGPIGPFANQGKGITDEFTWDSVRMGFRVRSNLTNKLSFRGKVMFIPWTHFEEEDIHHFRTELKQDPSFKSTARGGFGVQTDTTLSYNVWRGLSIEAGFQYWDIGSGEGTQTTRTLIGDLKSPFNGANSTRWGAIVGTNYGF